MSSSELYFYVFADITLSHIFIEHINRSMWCNELHAAIEYQSCDHLRHQTHSDELFGYFHPLCHLQNEVKEGDGRYVLCVCVVFDDVLVLWWLLVLLLLLLLLL